MEEKLIQTECYICMELTAEKSPCSCATTVHKRCLLEYLKYSGHVKCTICRDDFPVVRPRRCKKKHYYIALSCPILYFTFGFLGHCVDATTEYYLPFSNSNNFSALFGFGLILMIGIGCFGVRSHRVWVDSVD